MQYCLGTKNPPIPFIGASSLLLETLRKLRVAPCAVHTLRTSGTVRRHHCTCAADQACGPDQCAALLACHHHHHHHQKRAFVLMETKGFCRGVLWGTLHLGAWMTRARGYRNYMIQVLLGRRLKSPKLGPKASAMVAARHSLSYALHTLQTLARPLELSLPNTAARYKQCCCLPRLTNGLADLCAANVPPHHHLSPPWPCAGQAVSGLTRIDGSAWIAIASDWACVCRSVCVQSLEDRLMLSSPAVWTRSVDVGS